MSSSRDENSRVIGYGVASVDVPAQGIVAGVTQLPILIDPVTSEVLTEEVGTATLVFSVNPRPAPRDGNSVTVAMLDTNIPIHLDSLTGAVLIS